MRILDCVKRENVWYDESCKMEFSKNQFVATSPNDYNFEAPENKWLEWKFNHILTKFVGIGSGDNIFTNDYVYRKPLSFKKYDGSSILILGGGPSTFNLLQNCKSFSPDILLLMCSYF